MALPGFRKNGTEFYLGQPGSYSHQPKFVKDKRLELVDCKKLLSEKNHSA